MDGLGKRIGKGFNPHKLTIESVIERLEGSSQYDKERAAFELYHALIADVELDYSAVLPSFLKSLRSLQEAPGEALSSLEMIIKKLIKTEDYLTALKTTKTLTQQTMKEYEGKKDRDSLKARRKELAKWADFAQEIHDKINPVDKDKRFPVKHQPVKTIRKKVVRSG